jgi:hypothetical protein
MHCLNLNTNKVYISQTESTILPLINKTKYYLTEVKKIKLLCEIKSIKSLEMHGGPVIVCIYYLYL